MAITQGMCSSFKEELLEGVHNLLGDQIYIALYTSAATLSAATTIYTTANEVISSGGTPYVAGGQVLLGTTVALSGTTAIVDFTDAVFPAVTMTARGALIYNVSAGNKAIAVLDFGSDKTSTLGDFTIVFPVADAANAIIRIA